MSDFNFDTARELLSCVINKRVPTEFANAGTNVDVKSALRDNLQALVGTHNTFMKNRYDVYEILEKSIDEKLPQSIYQVLGGFADIMFVPNNTLVSFNIKTGKSRAKKFVTRATPSGQYETFRLDRKQVTLTPKTYGVGAVIDFNRYLGGLEDIMDAYDVMLEGLTRVVYEEIQSALIASWNDTGRPATNKIYMSSFDAAAMQTACLNVSPYGSPIIYCSPEFAVTMSNAITYNSTTKISNEDSTDVREFGYIGKFRGNPIVVLPQSFEDETNTKKTINPRFAYVIPSGGEPIVKVAFEGNTEIHDATGVDNSEILNGYRKLAVGIVSTPNYWTLVYNVGIAAGGWDNSAITNS